MKPFIYKKAKELKANIKETKTFIIAEKFSIERKDKIQEVQNRSNYIVDPIIDNSYNNKQYTTDNIYNQSLNKLDDM